MVRLSLILAAAFGICVISFPPTVLLAQDEFAGYAEESAGVMDYSDVEAAGDVPVGDDEMADGTVPDGSAFEGSGADTESLPSEGEGTVETSAGAAASMDIGVMEGAQTVKAGAQIADDEVPLPTVRDKEKGKNQSSRAERNDWEWGALRHHIGWSSTAGLMDIKEAGSNVPGTLSMGIFAGVFKYSDYLIRYDTHRMMTGSLNLRAVVWKYLEVHGAIRTYSVTNTSEYPALFQTIGDLELGAKGFYSINELITVGLDFNLDFRNTVGNVGINPRGTSIGLDGLATFDFTSISEKIPVRGHAMIGYKFDNAYHTIESIEKAGGGCGTDADGDGEVEYTGCISPVERTALGIDRNDHVHLGIGFDGLLPYVSPIVEYHIEIPVNRQGFTCPQIPGSYDSCMADAGVSAMRQWLNLGVRGLPPIKGLAVDFGVEVGLSGYAPSVHELAAQEPYMVKFGLSYQMNPFAAEQKCEAAEKVVEAPAPPVAANQARGAQIVGMVHDSESSETPVADAVVVYESLELNPQVTSGAGRFNSYELPAGDVALQINAPGYEEQRFVVTVPGDGYIEQLFPLVRKPQKGVVTVSLVTEKGQPVAGMNVQVTGAASGSFTSDDDGKVMLESDAGEIAFVVNDEKYLHRQLAVTVVADTHTQEKMVLKEKGKNALVVVKQDRIRIKRKIHFRTDSDIIEEDSYSLLDEVADTLMKNPQIRKVEIQGHTDDRGLRQHNVDLSQTRADSVRRYLITAGVEESRIESKGYGPDRPIAPNVIDSGRAKNRRVEFHIVASD